MDDASPPSLEGRSTADPTPKPSSSHRTRDATSSLAYLRIPEKTAFRNENDGKGVKFVSPFSSKIRKLFSVRTGGLMAIIFSGLFTWSYTTRYEELKSTHAYRDYGAATTAPAVVPTSLKPVSLNDIKYGSDEDKDKGIVIDKTDRPANHTGVVESKYSNDIADETNGGEIEVNKGDDEEVVENEERDPNGAENATATGKGGGPRRWEGEGEGEGEGDDGRYGPPIRDPIDQKEVRRSVANVFFVETSCTTKTLRREHKAGEGLVLNARQSCAIESTARSNPDRKIYLLHTCEIERQSSALWSGDARRLFSYPNFYVVAVRTEELLRGTPLQRMWNDGLLQRSDYPTEHISDAIRLVVLWKYGGTYLDLDVVTIRSLGPLKSNFAGIQDSWTINGAVLNVEPAGFAHALLTTCLENFRDRFDGKAWSANGPILITNALLKFCRVSQVEQMTESRCGGFHVYPQSVFYPIHYSDWRSLLDESQTARVMKTIENSTIVHMWNRLSRDGRVARGSNQAYSVLADAYCPRVYRAAAPYFKR